MSKILILVSIILCFSSRASFTFSTQNLWHYTTQYETRLQNLDNAFADNQADIMNFQEAWQSFGGKSLYNEILNKGLFNTHFVKTNNTLIMKEGLSIVTRFELADKKFTYKLPHSKFFGKRTMIISRVRLNSNKEVYVANIHLTPFTDGRDKRTDQLKFILDILKNNFSDLPVILTGDFNQEEDNDFFKPLLEAGFLSSLPGSCTYCANENPYVNSDFISKLDYIFYQPKFFNIIKARRIFVNNPISDHYGVKVEFKDLRDQQ